MKPRACFRAAALLAVLVAAPAAAQLKDPGFTVAQVMNVPFTYGLVGAARADRIAWMEAHQGRRNVYTAAAPDYTPVRVTSNLEDDAVDLTGLDISQDGSVVVFIRGHSTNFKGQIGNQASDPLGGHREVWAASTTGKRAPWRVLELAAERGQRGGGGGGRFGGGASPLSPDGRWYLYVEGGQIHRAAVDPGNADPAVVDAAPPLFVTLGENSGPAWSPDGKKIAFVTSRYDQRQYFPTQGQQPTHSFVAVYDTDSRRISYLAPSVDFDSAPVWSPDGKQILFTRRPGLPFGHFATAPLRSITREQVPAGFIQGQLEGGWAIALMLADVATGEAREVWHAARDAEITPGQGVRWAGDRVVFSAEQNTWTRWWSLPLNAPDAAPTLLTPGEGQVHQVALSDDGRTLFFTSNVGDQDRKHLWKVPVAGGQPQPMTPGQMVETALVVPGSGQTVALLQAGPRQAESVAIIPAAGGQVRVIGPKAPAEWPGAKHVIPQAVEVTAADGIVAHIILFVPPDLKPGEKRPALVYNHGNGGRLVLGYADQSDGYYHLNYAFINYLVNKGYIVAASNYRGDGALYSPSYNEQKDYGPNGVSEYRDVIAAGLYLKNRPDVDAARLGVYGLSYGAWLTGEALSRNSDVFKAGAIIAGVQMRSQSFDPENLAYQSSPAFNIGKWTSPTLFLHGDDDRNVEFSQTVGAVQALRARGTPVRAFVLPDETHYFMRWSSQVAAHETIDRFFDEMLIGKTMTTEQGARR
jgi:dipeptidyl aminopeptidase/acylaminoacyl peptidase